mmetsp:Transcript_3955/g.6929  ORF Transcript_3955/g.6929 Transcript_3955/m.6929 type:complete len:229 (+) Transcript_3955:667-1353(+)
MGLHLNSSRLLLLAATSNPKPASSHEFQVYTTRGSKACLDLSSATFCAFELPQRSTSMRSVNLRCRHHCPFSPLVLESVVKDQNQRSVHSQKPYGPQQQSHFEHIRSLLRHLHPAHIQQCISLEKFQLLTNQPFFQTQHSRYCGHHGMKARLHCRENQVHPQHVQCTDSCMQIPIVHQCVGHVLLQMVWLIHQSNVERHSLHLSIRIPLDWKKTVCCSSLYWDYLATN